MTVEAEAFVDPSHERLAELMAQRREMIVLVENLLVLLDRLLPHCGEVRDMVQPDIAGAKAYWLAARKDMV